MEKCAGRVNVVGMARLEWRREYPGGVENRLHRITVERNEVAK